ENLPQTVAIAGNVSTGGGDFATNSAGNIEFSLVEATISTSSGNVQLTADGNVSLPGGGIFTTGGNLIINGASVQTVAGNSTVIDTTGGSGGDVTITATTDEIGLNASSINSGGLIDLDAATNINTGDLAAQNGQITLDSTGDINSGGLTANGSNITIGSENLPQTVAIAGNVSTGGGDFNLTAAGDANFSLLSDTVNTGGGNFKPLQPAAIINLPAKQHSTTNGGIISITGTSIGETDTGITPALNSGATTGGDIIITATVGDITLNTSSLDASGVENSGNITIIATEGAIATNNLNATSQTGNGGTISLSAPAGIVTGIINSLTLAPDPVSQAGSVTLSSDGDISVLGINAAANTGTGGDIIFGSNLLVIEPTSFVTTGTAGSGNIDLSAATINGSGTLSLTAGTGAVTLGDTGNVTPLGGLIVQGQSVTVTLINAQGNIDINASEFSALQKLLPMLRATMPAFPPPPVAAISPLTTMPHPSLSATPATTVRQGRSQPARKP
ncbi:MAG: hypothetical protein HC890_13070, partial [Chloroflexaceae bacterium]|nr:hypothetical protein [Chloroflexaceae bacterium]